MDNSFSVLARLDLPVEIIDLFSEVSKFIDLGRQSNLNKNNELTIFFVYSDKSGSY
jgi:hypothetical protein